MGLSSLKKRIEQKELIICRSDKTVRPTEYLAMGEVHVRGDQLITLREQIRYGKH